MAMAMMMAGTSSCTMPLRPLEGQVSNSCTDEKSPGLSIGAPIRASCSYFFG